MFKRLILVFSCAIVISLLIGTITPLPWNLVGHDNQAENLISNEYKLVQEVSESSDSTNNNQISQDTQNNINSKATKERVSRVNQTPLTADFPLGWYVSVGNISSLDKTNSEGMNIVMPYLGKSNDADIVTYLDAAEKAKIQVLVELPRSQVKTGNIDAIVEFVRKFKNHPAVFAWYSADEPELNQLSPEILKKIYKAVKTEDQDKPVAIVFARLWGIEKYLDALDIFMWDQYPVTYDSPEFGSPDWRKMKSWFKKAASHSKGKDGFWFVLQGYGEKADGTPQFGKRLPTFKEERYMLYNAVLSGVNGLFLWAHYRSQQSWIDSVLTPIVREFHNYIPAIKAGNIADRIKVDQANIQTSLYQDPRTKRYFLVAINHGKGKSNAKIRLKQATRTHFARVLKEKRYVRLNNETDETTFKDTFSPYQVHIYQLL